MKINYKLFLLTLLVAIGVTLAGNWIFGISFKNYLLEQESNQITANVKTIASNLTASMQKYESITYDWAYWDETYEFIDGNNPDYITLNLGIDSIKVLDVSFMVFVNNDKEIVHQFYFDRARDSFVDLPDSLRSEIENCASLYEPSAVRIFECRGSYYIVSEAQTTDSLRVQPMNGYLIVGRLIDGDIVSELKNITDSEIVFLAGDTARAKIESGTAPYSYLETTAYSTLVDPKASTLTTLILPENPDGSTVLAGIQMVTGRDIYTGGIARLRTIQLCYDLFILLVVIILFLFWRAKLFIPLQRLSKELNNLPIDRDGIGILPASDKNEISYITGTINTMFLRIDEQQEKLRKSEARMVDAQTIAHVGNWELDSDTGIMWGSLEAFHIFGLHQDTQEILYKELEQYILPEYRESHKAAFNRLIAGDGQYDEVFKIRNARTFEERYLRSRAVRTFSDDTKKPRIAGTIQDITEYKKSEEEILYLSNHDQLTGLYNRRFYEKSLMRLDTEANLPLTVVMGDINGLKLINDSFGHTAGDELIIKAANVIQQNCREQDVVARLGGDEIVIVMPKTDADEAGRIIENIITKAAGEKVGSISVSISFGHETKYSMQQDTKMILKDTEDQMYRNKLYESSSARSRAIDIIMKAVYEKSEREMTHSMRVSRLCEAIGKSLRFSKDEVNQIRTAGLVHDIGKIGIDDKILNKTEPFDAHETKEMQKHCEVGYRILSSANEFSEIANFVLEHHEQWNGTGYPRNLKGEQISLQARIIAVADTYDAMTSGKPNKKPISEQEAVAEISRRAGTRLDPGIVRIFIDNDIGPKTQ